MEITTKNIDDFVRRAYTKGCRDLAWNEEDFKTLQQFAKNLGWDEPEDGGMYMGVKHYFVEDDWMTTPTNKDTHLEATIIENKDGSIYSLVFKVSDGESVSATYIDERDVRSNPKKMMEICADTVNEYAKMTNKHG